MEDDRSLEALERVIQGLEALVSRDDRFRPIAINRLGPRVKKTVNELAQRFELSLNRVGQLQKELLEELEEFRTDPSRSDDMAVAVGLVKQRIGHIARMSDKEAREIAAPGASKAVATLILWLAGPYERAGDDFIVDSRSNFRSRMNSATLSGALIEREEALELVRDLGLEGESAEDFLDGLPWLTELDGQLVLWGETLHDRVYGIVASRGEPMTVPEISVVLGDSYSSKNLFTRILVDPRFVRTDVRRIGLARWAMEEYSGIAQEIDERIARSGGEVGVDDLVVELTSSFSIKESSVRAYLELPRFEVRAGVVRLRDLVESPVSTGSISSVKGAYTHGDELIWHRAIDSAALRGSGCNFPNSLAAWLGMSPPSEMSFRGDAGSVALTWSDISKRGASMGSVRTVLRYLGVSGKIPGDAKLRVVLGRRDRSLRAEVWTGHGEPTASLGEQLAQLTGLPIPSDADRHECLRAVATALGIDPGEVQRTLRRRGDGAVADALQTRSASEGLYELARKLADQLIRDES